MKELHQTAINLIEAIETFEGLIRLTESSIKLSQQYDFNGMKKRCEHRKDIYQRSIKRLEQRYGCVMNKINQHEKEQVLMG